MTIKTVFMGTPEFAVASLQRLHDDPRVELTLVVSQPDRPSGRGKKLKSPPVVVAARALGLPTWQPETLRTDEAVQRLTAEAPELIVVAAYGQILREPVLELPRLGCINVHASLLPRWRGAAPIHRAIEAGDATTGVCIMGMERGLDTGPVWAAGSLMIGDTETAGELHDRLAPLGASLLAGALPSIIEGATPVPQPGARKTYARMLGAADRVLDFEQSALLVTCSINGMSPSPGKRIALGGELIGVMRAEASERPEGAEDAVPGEVVVASPKHGLLIACSTGAVSLLELKRPGKRALSIRDALNGLSIAAGDHCAEAP
ncbi:MAG: methionyl-tRNA formyltransferase [Bradymonadia bacterium]|jgi:methionyl-tRNA formyltransferase